MAENYRVLRHFKAGGVMRKPGDIIDISADPNDWRNARALVDQRYLAPAGDGVGQNTGGAGPTPDPKIAQDRAVEAAAGRDVLETADVATDDKALDNTRDADGGGDGGEVISIEEGKKLKGKLPEGFPGHAALEEAGMDTYAKVRKELDRIEDVDGVGPKLAIKIRAKFGIVSDDDAGDDAGQDEAADDATAHSTGEPGDSTVPKAPNA